MKESGLWKEPWSVLLDLASLGSSQSSPHSTLDSGPALDALGKPGGSSLGLIKRSSWKHRPSFVIVKIQDPGSRISKFTRRRPWGEGDLDHVCRILDSGSSTLAKYGQLPPDLRCLPDLGSWILGMLAKAYTPMLRHGERLPPATADIPPLGCPP